MHVTRKCRCQAKANKKEIGNGYGSGEWEMVDGNWQLAGVVLERGWMYLHGELGGVSWQMTQFTRNELCKLRLISFAILPPAVGRTSNVRRKMKCISQISFLQKACRHSFSIPGLPALRKFSYKLPNLIKAKLAEERSDNEG